MAPINLRNPGRPIHVGIILSNSTTEILDVAPIDLMSGISRETVESFPEGVLPPALKSQALDFTFHWVNQSGKPASLTSGASVNITDTFDTCPPLDIAIMGANTYTYEPSAEEIAFVRKTYFEDCTAFLTICGGFMVPMQSGLFAGRTATAPRVMLPMLKAQNEQIPDVAQRVKWTEKRWQVSEDGKLWTSGTLLNGTDMMRAFGRKIWGGEGTLMDMMLDLGAWPERDNDFRPMTVESKA